jgi:dolichyl-phosphate-mannose-protein mannosyltransferase
VNVQKILNQLERLLRTEFSWGVIVAVGIVLRLRQYFANRSLWVDEASLALNIVDRSLRGLIQPLDYNQGAPSGFLFVEKFATLIMGNNEYGLRLFPLLSGLLSVYLMYLIAKERLGIKGLLAVSLIAISPPLIYYSAELKQYSSDLMTSLLLIYLSTLCLRGNPRTRDFILLGLAGSLSIWLSHPSAFVLAGIGLVLATEKLLKKAYTQFACILGIGAVWSFMLGLTYLLSLRYLAGSNYLKDYWLNHFLPMPIWSHLDWYKNTFTSLLANIGPGLSESYLAVGCLILIGFVSFFFRQSRLAILMISPFLTTCIASALQLYPLSGRFMLFLVPFVTLLMAEGLGRIYSLAANWNRNAAVIVYAVAVSLLLWTPGYVSIQNAIRPAMGEHIKPVLAHIATNMREGDLVYVFSGSVTPFKYYAPAYRLDTGNVIVAENSSGVKRFIRDVNDLRGKKRIWFIFSHVIGCGDCEGDKLQFYVNTLNTYGLQRDEFHAPGAAVFLYDLNP